MILLALLLVSATMLAFSCGASDDAAMPTARPEATTRPGDAGAEGAAQDGAGALRTAQVVHALEIANTAAVEHGTVARTKAQSEAVKQFAAMVVSDHSAANERLHSLAAQRGLRPEASPVSDAMSAESTTFAKRLEPLAGAAFDKSYMDTQIVTHVKLLAVIDDVLAPAVADAQLEELVKTLRSTVAVHEVQAERIRGALETGTTRPDGGTIQSDGGIRPR
ncbi:MAG TPA: DUF4142 domain-containing protein [Labilithrix sp.]|nr:DUF4142 domain-containing protein [Labilithrix sp.]